MNRRDFIKKSSIITASLGVGLSLLNCRNQNTPTIIPDSEKIRIGIIGLGDRGNDIIKVLNVSPFYKVVACCDILEFRLNEGKNKIAGNPIPYTDYQQMLKNTELEAVIISTPLHEHYRMVMDALDANVHIMCEKALAYNIEQSKAIKTKAQKSDKLFQVSYQYQLNPTFKAIKEIINKGHCGKLIRVEAMWHRNNNWRRPVPKPMLERQINWRMYREYSGGLMAELGSHHLNMIDNIMGSHPSKVVGTGGIDYWKDGREVFDNVFAIFDYPNGAKASFSSILSNKYEGQTIKFYGDKATIVTHQMNDAWIFPEREVDKTWGEDLDSVSGASIKIINGNEREKRKITVHDEEAEKAPFDDNYLKTTWLLYRNFAAAIKGKKELFMGLKDGYQSAISVHLANMAMREDQTMVWLPEYNV